MKVPALILALAVILVKAQDYYECKCGMFVTLRGDEKLVHTLPPISINNCNAFDTCKALCALEFRALTNNGDLNYTMDNGYTVGQELCLFALVEEGLSELHHEQVYGYARQCNGPWDFDGATTFNDLCCENGRNYECDES